MARQGLAQRASNLGPAGVAGLLGAVHAQVMAAAELSIGRRIEGGTAAEVRHALWDERTLVKTFGPRGTIHLLAAADLAMWTGALSALPRSAPSHPDPVRFAPGQAEEVIAAIADALEDAELTVDELTREIERRAGGWAVERTMPAFQDAWPRWRQLTSTAAHRGVLCFGPNRGRHVTYANPRRWLPGFEPQEQEAALGELVRRYLYVYGPATPDHFARWLAISGHRAAELFTDLAGQLELVDLDGVTAWTAAGDTSTPSEPAPGVRLLPYFDGYVVAGQPREWLFPGEAARRALTPSRQVGNYPVLLIDGIVAGVWQQARYRRDVSITVEPFQEMTPARQSELEAEVELVGSVLESRATLTLGVVSVGAHA